MKRAIFFIIIILLLVANAPAQAIEAAEFPLLALLDLNPSTEKPIQSFNYSQNFSPENIKAVAILDFGRDPKVTISTDIVIDKFTSSLLGAPFKLVDRRELKKIMTEVGFQYSDSGIIDDKTKQQLKQIGADSILTGKLYSYEESRRADGFTLNSEVYLIAKMIKVDTGEIIWSSEMLRKSKASRPGKKTFFMSENSADEAVKILDQIISEMSLSLKKVPEKPVNMLDQIIDTVSSPFKKTPEKRQE